MNSRIVTRQHAGFTLMELMIAVVIIGILAAVATPIYMEGVKKSRRSDAQGALSSFASSMARYHTRNNFYTGAGTTGGGDTGAPTIFPTESPIDSGTKFYDLTIVAATSSAYTLRATPKNGQAGDGIIEINSLGVKSWDENDDGDVVDSGENDWSRG
ncbi:MAG: prepilin-type N-terminal cleavage/methylation domain-containing protein [Pseudomonadales bacterium]|nr:prepilin-type N-terminal cleavage/methylation domain-containing protein [Pseudomonadales bacterium]